MHRRGKKNSNLKPIICPVRIPPVRKMELPMAMPPLRCFGATSPIYRGCTQIPIPASKWRNIFLLIDCTFLVFSTKHMLCSAYPGFVCSRTFCSFTIACLLNNTEKSLMKQFLILAYYNHTKDMVLHAFTNRSYHGRSVLQH